MSGNDKKKVELDGKVFKIPQSSEGLMGEILSLMGQEEEKEVPQRTLRLYFEALKEIAESQVKGTDRSVKEGIMDLIRGFLQDFPVEERMKKQIEQQFGADLDRLWPLDN